MVAPAVQTPLYQLRVPGSSVWTLTLASLTNESTAALLTDSDVTCWASLTDWSGNSVLTATAMSYVAPGEWEYEVPATAAVDGTGPWLLTVQVRGSGGLDDVLDRSFYARVTENNSQ